MKVIILCAGFGRRIGLDKPKCLLRINGKTLLDRTLSILKKNKIKKKDITLALGFKSHLILKYTKKKFNYFTNKKFKQTNMVYSFFKCLKKNDNKSTIILYGDIFYSNEIIKKIINSKGKLVTAVDKNWKKMWQLKNDLKEDLETLKIKNNRIINLGKKTHYYKNIDARFIGATKFDKKVLNFFLNYYSKKIKMKNRIKYFKLDMTNLLMLLIKKGFNLEYTNNRDLWFEFDNQKDVKIFKKYAKNNFIKKFN
tara:strand:- start:3475 stop:4233 length:759 start_codon:yes stop_codon:yes gene_type:complete